MRYIAENGHQRYEIELDAFTKDVGLSSDMKRRFEGLSTIFKHVDETVWYKILFDLDYGYWKLIEAGQSDEILQKLRRGCTVTTLRDGRKNLMPTAFTNVSCISMHFGSFGRKAVRRSSSRYESNPSGRSTTWTRFQTCAEGGRHEGTASVWGHKVIQTGRP